MTALSSALHERAMYRFPAPPDARADEETQARFADEYAAGPRGVIVFDPTRAAPSFGMLLGTEFGSGALCALLASLVLASSAGGYGRRVLIVAALGLFAALSIDVSYSNWDRFPTAFMLSSLGEQTIGWFLAGLALAKIVPPRC